MTTPKHPIRICRVDYADPVHASALVALLDAYAHDPMGGGSGLSEYAKTHVVAGLAARPQAFSVLAFARDENQTPVGLVNCIEGFSTFAAKPLFNIHDVVPVVRTASHHTERCKNKECLTERGPFIKNAKSRRSCKN
jgi:hypothetical protein